MDGRFQYFVLKYPLVKDWLVLLVKNLSFLVRMSLVQPLTHHAALHKSSSLEKAAFPLHRQTLRRALCWVVEQTQQAFLHFGSSLHPCFLKLSADFVLPLAEGPFSG